MGAVIESVIFIFPDQLIQPHSLEIGSGIKTIIGGNLVGGLIDLSVYLVLGGIVTGLVAGNGVIKSTKAGILAGLTSITFLTAILAIRMIYLNPANLFIALSRSISMSFQIFILATLGGLIGGLIGEGIYELLNITFGLINSEFFNKIILFVKLISEQLKDDRLRNTKSIKYFKNHILILAFVTNLIGFSLIATFFLSDNYGQKKVNSIEIDTSLQNNSDTPFLINISMFFNYKEPVLEKTNLNFEIVCINITRNPLNNESVYAPIDLIELYLYNMESLNLGNMYENSIAHYTSSNVFEPETLNSSQCYPYKDVSVISINPYSDNQIKIGYYLSYTTGYSTFISKGNAGFFSPIKVIDSVNAMNIQINNRILLLTGVLLILGSFPFFVALKQLLSWEQP